MENKPIKDLSVPNLKQKGVSVTDSSEVLQGAQILKDPSHPGSARISYRPLQMGKLQSLLKSNHALQFSVRYDVDRVSLPLLGFGHEHTWATRQEPNFGKF